LYHGVGSFAVIRRYALGSIGDAWIEEPEKLWIVDENVDVLAAPVMNPKHQDRPATQ